MKEQLKNAALNTLAVVMIVALAAAAIYGIVAGVGKLRLMMAQNTAAVTVIEAQQTRQVCSELNL